MKYLSKMTLTLMALFFAVGVWAESADALVNQATQAMITRLKAESATIKANPKHVEQIVKEVVLPVVDAQAISKSVLARHFGQASDAQKQAFASEFEAFLIRFYARAFANYDGEEIVFDGTPELDSRGRALVKTNIVRRNNQKIPVAYRLAPEGQSWKVYDVIVEGISLVLSKRNEFDPLINRQGLDQVIADLRKVNQEAVK